MGMKGKSLINALAVVTILGLMMLVFSVRAASSTGWGVAQLVETEDSEFAMYPEVAVDGSGNAVAVWYQFDNTRLNIWSNRYVVGSGWGVAELIETNDSGSAGWPQVSVDSPGNAIAVWEQDDGTRYNVWSNRYAVGTGWGTAELIETDDSGNAWDVRVSEDASGNAFAVWSQNDGVRFNIMSNRYVVGSGWGVADLVETDDSGNATDPELSVEASGNAIVVWSQYDGATFNIRSSRFPVGTGWGTAEFVETDDSEDAKNPMVSLDSSGTATAVWFQYNGTRSDIWSNRNVLGTGWGVAHLIETDDSGNASYPQVSADSSGNVIAVWQQQDGNLYNIWSNRYALGTGWGDAELIETEDLGSAYYPQVSVDSSGDGIAVWSQVNGDRKDVWSNRYTIGDGWGTATLIETNDSGDAIGPKVCMYGSGKAIVVWSQWDGACEDIWSNHYIEPETDSQSLLPIALVAIVAAVVAVIAYVFVRRRQPPKEQRQA